MHYSAGAGYADSVPVSGSSNYRGKDGRVSR